MNMDDSQLGGWLTNFGFQPTTPYNTHQITDWIVGSADHSSTASGGCSPKPPE
jgi:hypothetical protein